MRIDTPCFEGFVKMCNEDDWYLDERSYSADTNGFILEWNFYKVQALSVTYERAWNDAAKQYNSF